MRLSLFDFMPKFCPGCGEELRLDSEANRDDYEAGCSHTCRTPGCGVKFQKADAWHMVDAATLSGGDLAQYTDT